MPEIGRTLREARMRRRIDMTEVEGATKIRAKYLRALESEEWDLLPGPTFVKTFLRTYAEFLGLDAKVLVEEYKQRYERPSTVELAPYKPVAMRRDRRQPRHGPPLSPVVVLVAGALLVLGALYLLGSWGGDDNGSQLTPSVTPAATGAPTPAPGSSSHPAARRRRTVTLRIAATGQVYVCLVTESGKKLIGGRDLQAGQTAGPYRGRSFKVTFGNGQARLRVDRRSYEVPDRATPVGFEIRAGRRLRELPAAQRPVCA